MTQTKYFSQSINQPIDTMSITLENKFVFSTGEKLYLNVELADVQFVFDSDGTIQKLPANKALLALQSCEFNRMFFGDLKVEGDAYIADFEADAFKEFLQFFYLSKITLTIKNIGAVVRLADEYDILDRLIQSIPVIMQHLTLKNICCAWELSIHLKDKQFEQFCEEKISHTPAVFLTPAFLCMPKERLERILNMKLEINAIDVFRAVLEWAKFACKENILDENLATNLRDQLGDCLKMVPFGRMKIGEFMDCYKSHRGLFTFEEFEEIVLILTTGYAPSIFGRNHQQTQIARDAIQIVYCSRTFASSDGDFLLEDKDITRLMVNKSAHLIAISIQELQYLGSDLHYAVIAIAILEYDKNDIHNKKPKTIYKGETDNWDNTNRNYNLIDKNQIPIKLFPHFVYEIQLDIYKTEEIRTLPYESNQKIIPPSDFKVKLIKHSSVNRDITTTGVIEALTLRYL